MEEVSIYEEKPDINIVRKVYNESRLSRTYGTGGSTSAKSSHNKRLHTVYTKLASCSCSGDGFSRFLFRLAPILRWLPKYRIKNDLMADITGGVTVGIMHIPQGNLLKYRTY